MESKRRQFYKEKIKDIISKSEKVGNTRKKKKQNQRNQKVSDESSRENITESSAGPTDTEVTDLGCRSYLEQNQDLLIFQSAPAETNMQIEGYKKDVSF